MTAQELAQKFRAKVAAAAIELDRQSGIAADNTQKRADDVQHCKNAFEQNVIPFLNELKQEFGAEQFSFAPQIDLHDHKTVGVSFKIGDGSATSISTAFGNIVVTRFGESGSQKGLPFVYPPDQEPYISNSGDLTSDKIAKLVEMAIDNAGG
jgi:hypothetical protein